MVAARQDEECAVTAFGVVTARLDDIPGLRKSLGPTPETVFQATLLKASDEQTVLAVAALLRARERFSSGTPPMSDWGVVAAPRWLGRLGAAATIDRFRGEGSRSTSPLVVPNLSLHAVSATVSLAFQIRGPNFGVGGGPHSLAEGLLAGLSLQLEGQVPGTWLLLSEWETEPTANDNPAPLCRAAALALAPVRAGESGLRLRLEPEPSVRALPNETRLGSLADFLDGCAAQQRRRWSCSLEWGATLVLTDEVSPR